MAYKNWIRNALAVVGVAALLFGVVRLLWPSYIYPVRTAFTAERCGCAVSELWGSAVSEVRQERRAKWVERSSRLLARDVYVDEWATPFGTYWAPRFDTSLFGVLAEMEQDPYAIQGGEGIRGGVVLDCGAHLGSFTRKALDQSARLVVAIEPGDVQVACLRRTFAKEIAEGRVIVYPKGVWDSETELSFSDEDVTSAGAHVTASQRGYVTKIPVTTIDQLAAELKLPRVDFIKMDIEGAEQNALTGARGVLAQYRPRMAIAGYHKHDDSEVLPAVIRKAQPAYQWRSHRCRSMDGHQHPLTFLFW